MSLGTELSSLGNKYDRRRIAPSLMPTIRNNSECSLATVIWRNVAQRRILKLMQCVRHSFVVVRSPKSAVKRLCNATLGISRQRHHKVSCVLLVRSFPVQRLNCSTLSATVDKHTFPWNETENALFSSNIYHVLKAANA